MLKEQNFTIASNAKRIISFGIDELLMSFLFFAIYSKEKRKSKINLDIQNAEIIAPKGSHRLDSYHPETTCDFSSGNANAKVFAIMIPINQKMTCVYIEPDEKMIEHMKQWMGMKMFVD